jgi:transcriptional regulator GlxA family with amidase domain
VRNASAACSSSFHMDAGTLKAGVRCTTAVRPSVRPAPAGCCSPRPVCSTTIHWATEAYFRERHPEVVLRLDETLVVAGDGRLVTSGASTAWHDLALYLVARHIGPATAQDLARCQLLQWRKDGQAAFQVFDPGIEHGDAVVLAAQRWIADNYAVASPVTEMVRRSGLSERTFKRRFREATGETTIAYVQRIRVERAKRALETGGAPIEGISWAVGYEDPASFRRLFKRVTGLTPGEYRRRFQLPDLPHVSAAEPTPLGS